MYASISMMKKKGCGSKIRVTFVTLFYFKIIVDLNVFRCYNYNELKQKRFEGRKHMINLGTNKEAIELNKTLEVVNIDGLKFKDGNGYWMVRNRRHGWALKTSKGYVKFKEDSKGNTPYRPQGGKKTAEMIVNDGGFLDYDDVEFVQPTN